MAYEYDLFISYRRRDSVADWVRLHLRPRLEQSLYDHLPHDPKIWIDVEQAEGVDWRENLTKGLTRSKLLLPVWSPDYFRSEYCMAEWVSMRKRQELLQQESIQLPPSLVYPVKYSDGNHYHKDAKAIECKKDFSSLNYPYQTFKDSARYMQFHDLVDQIAVELTVWLALIPDWREDWPIETPAPMDPVTSERPEI
ncbi:MAG: hypothetical protein NPIRA05_19140 [Nitrospirales bacterium]|nr:MAG: hypothetical protein NPIRA05_19140 [Nitrospirales bacterium]